MSDTKQFTTALEALKDSGRDIKDLFAAAVSEAATAAVKELETKAKAKRKNAVQSTKRILLHYHQLKAAHRDAVYNLKTLPEQEGEHEKEVDDMMRRTISKYDVRIESIEKSAAKTHLYMKDIDAALESYRHSCLISDSENQRRRWRVLEARYIDDIRKTTRQIAVEEYVDIRTVQKDLKAAIEELTVQLFGVEGLLDIG